MNLSLLPGALCCPPITKASLSHCNDELEAAGFHSIPQSYADFLTYTNGFAWNGYEFYGSSIICERDSLSGVETGYCLYDIVSHNESFHTHYPWIDKLLLGHFDFSYYTYDPHSCKFEELDRDSPQLDSMQQFDSFDQLISKLMRI